MLESKTADNPAPKSMLHIPPLLNPFHFGSRAKTKKLRSTGRRYDHNFLQKFGVFSQKPSMINFFQKLCSSAHKNAIFRQILWRKYFKNHNIGP
jgi:hypothetical protein